MVVFVVVVGLQWFLIKYIFGHNTTTGPHINVPLQKKWNLVVVASNCNFASCVTSFCYQVNHPYHFIMSLSPCRVRVINPTWRYEITHRIPIIPSLVRNPDTIVSCTIAMHIGPKVTRIRATRNIVLRLQYTLWIIWSAERASRWRCANAADKEECNIPSIHPELQRAN